MTVTLRRKVGRRRRGAKSGTMKRRKWPTITPFSILCSPWPHYMSWWHSPAGTSKWLRFFVFYTIIKILKIYIAKCDYMIYFWSNFWKLAPLMRHWCFFFVTKWEWEGACSFKISSNYSSALLFTIFCINWIIKVPHYFFSIALRRR